MTTPSKAKSCFKRLLFKIYARWFCENNKKLCTDCLKPRSNKTKFESKNCGYTGFMCSIIKILHLKYCPVCNAQHGSIVKN